MNASCYPCPNPFCSFIGSTFRGLSYHLNSVRGQPCRMVAESTSGGSSRQRTSLSNLTICSINRNQHNNYTSFATMMPQLGSQLQHNNVSDAPQVLHNNNENQLPPNGDVDDVIMVNDDNIEQNAPNINDVQECFMYSNHTKMVAKLFTLLNSYHVPTGAFQQIVEWYEDAHDLGVSFKDRPKTWDANLELLRKAIPKGLSTKLLPHTVPVMLNGFTEPVEIVRFDIVPMILSLLQDEVIMKKENLHINENDPFDNFIIGLTSNEPIGEARLGSAYQEYLRSHPPNINEFIFDMIFNCDRTHIDMLGRFTCCPLLFTSSLFKEESR